MAFRPLLARRACSLVLSGVLLACGGDGSTGPGDAAVSTVLVSGAPTVPVLVGGTVQLAASALNETGAMLPNQRVTWKSSDGDIALVSTGGLVTAVGAGSVTITASSGGKEAGVVLDVRAGGPMSTEGGTLTMLGGRAVLVVPAGSLVQSTSILLAPSTAGPQDARLVPGSTFELTPEGLVFTKGATLTLGYDPARLPTGVTAASLQLYILSNGAWVQVRGSTVDTIAKRVTGAVTRTGVYAVVGTPVDRVTLGGGQLGGALFVAQTAQLTATVYDALNTVLTGRDVRWTSSDGARATVDGAGKVTAVGVGTVTITATSEGKGASTTLEILARPTADWSQAAEWTTYQGNVRHTGFQPVTADPGAFRELWVTTPFSGSALHPVVAADGRVFVSSKSYFGKQWLGVLDARSGGLQWSRDFGDIHGVHPPAYASGTVYVTTSGHEDSFLWALEAGTGTVRFRSAYGNQWSTYYAPVIVGDAVYMAGGYYGGAYSFRTTDGAQRWFATTLQYDQWTPAVHDGRVYAYTGKLTVHDATTGSQLYEIADPKFAWSGWSTNLAPVLGGANDLLVTNGGRLISYDLQARAIGWEQKASFTGTVTVAGGLLYVVNNGQVDVRRQGDGSLVGPWVPPEGRVQGPTIVTNNLLFASTTANTYAVDLATRRQVWSYPAGGTLALSGEGVLYIAQANGKLAAIAVK